LHKLGSLLVNTTKWAAVIASILDLWLVYVVVSSIRSLITSIVVTRVAVSVARVTVSVSRVAVGVARVGISVSTVPISVVAVLRGRNCETCKKECGRGKGELHFEGNIPRERYTELE